MYYLTDTHPLVWSFCMPERLSATAREIFEQALKGQHTIFIPAVVLAELTILAEKRRLPATSGELLQALTSLRNASNYLFLPLQPATVIASHTLTTVPDIFDRLIITEARRLNVSVITCDTTIIDSGLVDVLLT
jgi:PIN domain nuclease of toxin-antitoxin system